MSYRHFGGDCKLSCSCCGGVGEAGRRERYTRIIQYPDAMDLG